ncbi:MAG: zinc metallopeptidase [Paracoccaceae bacterium]|nr:zinc metallopeptidase [Paracoccaceae bacterium]
MKWRGRRTSRNIDDRRGQSAGFPGFGRAGGDGRRIRMGGRRSGIGGLGLIVVIGIALLMGVNPLTLLTGDGSGFTVPTNAPSSGSNQIDDTSEEFVSVVLADTEDVWGEIFKASDKQYRPPTLVLFSDRVSSACGLASAASGPFYCPGDRQAYLDMSFFQVMDRRLGAKGDFARAYVIAHEIAHHVQNELGVMEQVNRLRQRSSQVESNQLSVMLELQADCYSGVWAHHAQRKYGLLEPGDIEEALNAANQIGDDTLQRSSGQAVVPDSFTHGTSEQRVRWFTAGMQSGDPGQCDTFNASRL